LDFGIATPDGVHSMPLNHSLPEATIAQAAAICHWVVENAKSARAFLKRVALTHPLQLPLQALQVVEMPREAHKNPRFRWDASALLAPALRGEQVGLLSEAGMPAVADPGSEVVRAAHALGVPVRALPGPSALLLALAASGLNGQQFRFSGYLPAAPGARAQMLRDLEALSAHGGESQLFIEVPHRNAALWDTMLNTLKPGTRAFVASGLTTPGAAIHSSDIKTLRIRAELPVDNPLAFAPSVFELPCVFGLASGLPNPSQKPQTLRPRHA
jgi:16S rRNA (cytidine1402-2'-O)-methyltransferase